MSISAQAVRNEFTGAANDDDYAGPQAAPSNRFTGYNDILNVADQDKSQFLLMYDTNHQNRAMATYPLENSALDIAQAHGVKNIFIEFPREMQSIIDARASDAITHEQFKQQIVDTGWTTLNLKDTSETTKDDFVLDTAGGIAVIEDHQGREEYLNRLSQGIMDAKAHGIRVVGADSSNFISADRMSHDADVANYIAQVAGDQKSVITYGAKHGSDAAQSESDAGGLDGELRKLGRVTTVEMNDTLPPSDGSATANLIREAREGMFDMMEDRSPNRLDIQTGVLNRQAPEAEDEISDASPWSAPKPAPRLAGLPMGVYA